MPGHRPEMPHGPGHPAASLRGRRDAGHPAASLPGPPTVARVRPPPAPGRRRDAMPVRLGRAGRALQPGVRRSPAARGRRVSVRDGARCEGPRPVERAAPRATAPPRRPSASRRAGTSTAAFACSVPAPPSWPVLSAPSRSTTSGPRHSPTTSRSGRMRSASRTRSRSVTAPIPSTLEGRDRSATTWVWAGRNSEASSTTTIRSFLGHQAEESGEQSRLPGAGAARDEVGESALDNRDQKLGGFSRTACRPPEAPRV